MKCKHHNWTIEELTKKRLKINPQPQWQRGDSWKTDRQQLLIDSILLGFDIPKIYLWKTHNDFMYDYVVADGQQRLKAIWGFIDDKYSLSQVPNKPWYGLKFSQLGELQKHINQYTIIIAEVEATASEIRELFARLQKGVALTPVQIRNSLPSTIGDVIRGMALEHEFFKNSQIPADGFKRDDYLAHAFAIELSAGRFDLKASNLSQMYKENALYVDAKVISKVDKVLDFMDDVQKVVPRVIITKWGFVDLYWVLSENIDSLSDAKTIGIFYSDFEKRRKRFISDPSPLSDTPSPEFDKELFDYIEAFKTSGGTAKNLATRHRVLNSKLKLIL